MKKLLTGMVALLLLAGCNNAKKQPVDDAKDIAAADTVACDAVVAVLQNDSLRNDSVLRELGKKYEIWGFNEGVSVICGGKCGLIDSAGNFIVGISSCR